MLRHRMGTRLFLWGTISSQNLPQQLLQYENCTEYSVLSIEEGLRQKKRQWSLLVFGRTEFIPYLAALAVLHKA